MQISSIDIKVDNTDLIKNATLEAIETALEAVGMQVEGYAKLLCPVDTGLLRNSITHAVHGQPVAVDNYATNPTHATTEATKRAGTAGKRVSPSREGAYSGNAPSGDRAVYIGTNVEYAPYVEVSSSGRKAQPFLKPAVENHRKEYEEIFEEQLKNANV